MSGSVEARLKALAIDLPDPPAAVGAYVPYVITGHLVFVSGQLPVEAGELAFRGQVGVDLDLDAGYRAARLCAINLLAQLRAACGGDLVRIRRIVRVGGFVASGPSFSDHPKVINGASDLLFEVFGEAGRHARFAVGAPSLPLGAAVEIDAVAEIG